MSLLETIIRFALFIVGSIDYLSEFFISNEERANRTKKKSIRSKISDLSDPSSSYKTCEYEETLKVDDKDLNVFDELNNAFEINENADLFGVREIKAIEMEKQQNGKIFKKFVLGDYKWESYKTVQKRILNFSNGLLNIGIKPKSNIVIYSETRPEWMISALACFRINVPVVTLYATLGTEALRYGIIESESTAVITTIEQVPKIEEIINQIPNHVILIIIKNAQSELAFDTFKNKFNNFKIYEMSEIEGRGSNISESSYKLDKPIKDDLAVIMYTSGSTGNPKGVMLTHANIISSIRTYPTKLGKILFQKETYIAYLPLAHILELVTELSCILSSVRIGYSSPLTLTDQSPGMKLGQKGDITVLKPTIMVSVPLILERICKAIQNKIDSKGPIAKFLFQTAFEQKLKAFQNNRKTSLLDAILFNKMKTAIHGGKVKIIFCGGSLLNENTQKFVQVCLSPVIQAYALTETCGGGTIQSHFDTDTQICGGVMQYCELRLVDWEEGGYHNNDKPNPRGEIHIGGDSVASGYYKLPEITKETFYYRNGVRYCATGDIGEMLPNGTLKIIDRKKDIVKLQGGEYVSLNKVETCLKLLPFVENCWVYANPLYSYCVCFICPNYEKLRNYCDDKEIEGISSLKDCCNSTILQECLVKDIKMHCLKNLIEGFEIPAKVKVVEDMWLPDTGLVTDSFKLKRKAIEKFYTNELQKLYI